MKKKKKKNLLQFKCLYKVPAEDFFFFWVKKIYGFFFGYCNHDIYGAKKIDFFPFSATK